MAAMASLVASPSRPNASYSYQITLSNQKADRSTPSFCSGKALKIKINSVQCNGPVIAGRLEAVILAADRMQTPSRQSAGQSRRIGVAARAVDILKSLNLIASCRPIPPKGGTPNTEPPGGCEFARKVRSPAFRRLWLHFDRKELSPAI